MFVAAWSCFAAEQFVGIIGVKRSKKPFILIYHLLWNSGVE